MGRDSYTLMVMRGILLKVIIDLRLIISTNLKDSTEVISIEWQVSIIKEDLTSTKLSGNIIIDSIQVNVNFLVNSMEGKVFRKKEKRVFWPELTMDV